MYLLFNQATEVSEGMPVGVMVVALRYRDELCLRVMKELEPYGEKVKVKAASIWSAQVSWGSPQPYAFHHAKSEKSRLI